MSNLVLSSGEFVGMVADDPHQKIELTHIAAKAPSTVNF
jgi:hypothetical protein